jgi:hypothetical protein
VAQVRGYTDEQFRRLEDALNQLEPIPDELDDLLVNLGVLLEGDYAAALPPDWHPPLHY